MVLLAVGACPGAAAAQAVTVEPLGSIVLTVGTGALGEYGYRAGAFGYGSASGLLPGGLFTDGVDRALDAVVEDSVGTWRVAYSGGAAAGWHSAAVLDNVVMTAEYADAGHRATRSYLVVAHLALDAARSLHPRLECARSPSSSRNTASSNAFWSRGGESDRPGPLASHHPHRRQVR